MLTELSDNVDDLFGSIFQKPEPPPDPNAVLIPKHRVGKRNFKPIYLGGLAISTFALVTTIAEQVPLIRDFVFWGYVIGFGFLIITDMSEAQAKNGVISREHTILIACVYGFSIFMMIIVSRLVLSI